MKIRRNWKEVERVLYDIWCMHQSDIMLPKFLDNDFKNCFENVKRKYKYKQICEILDI